MHFAYKRHTTTHTSDAAHLEWSTWRTTGLAFLVADQYVELFRLPSGRVSHNTDLLTSVDYDFVLKAYRNKVCLRKTETSSSKLSYDSDRSQNCDVSTTSSPSAIAVTTAAGYKILYKYFYHTQEAKWLTNISSEMFLNTFGFGKVTVVIFKDPVFIVTAKCYLSIATQ